MARQRKHYSIDNKVADNVYRLRKFFKIKMTDQGLPIKDDGLEIKVIDEVYGAENETGVTKIRKNTLEFTKFKGSPIQDLLDSWIEQNEQMNNEYDFESSDPTAFLVAIRDVVYRAEGKEGKVVKAQRTESKKKVQGGSGLKRRIQSLSVNFNENYGKQLKETREYKYGGLNMVEYSKLRKAVGQRNLEQNNFREIYKLLQLDGISQRTKFARTMKSNYSAEIGRLLIKFMSYRTGVGYIREKDVVESPRIELEKKKLPKEFIPFVEEVSDTTKKLTVFMERNLINFLRDPKANDEDLLYYLPTGSIEDINLKSRQVLKKIYGDSFAHLSSAKLPEDFENWDVEKMREWVDSQFKRGANFKVTENVKKLAKQMYKEGKISKEALDALLEANIGQDMAAYFEKVFNFYVGIKTPPKISILEDVARAMKRTTSKIELRTENWFKAAFKEFGSNTEKFAVLIDLATRIVDQQGYEVLFEENCGINIWYYQWGDGDEQIEQLISNLEAVSGLKRDESLEETAEEYEDFSEFWAELHQKHGMVLDSEQLKNFNEDMLTRP